MMYETLHIPLAIAGEGSIHVCMDEIPTITIYSRGHPLETIILGMNKLNMGQVDAALEIYAEQHGTVVGTILGVTNDSAVFTPTENWTRDLGFEDNTVHFVTWEDIRSLLSIKP
jgi:hypothetical protein